MGSCDSQLPDSFDLEENDYWECRGIVPDYRNTPAFESPVVSPDFQEVVYDIEICSFQFLALQR